MQDASTIIITKSYKQAPKPADVTTQEPFDGVSLEELAARINAITGVQMRKCKP